MIPRYVLEEGCLKTSFNKRYAALLFDFDGTLVPIRKDPNHCYLSAEIKTLLKSILSSEKSFVTVLSGRSLSDLRSRFSMDGLFYVGSHGLEISGPGVRFVHQNAYSAGPVINYILQNLKKELNGYEGIFIEEKPYSLAVHYRNVPKSIVPFVRKTFYRMAAGNPVYRHSLSIIKGKKVLELLPSGSWNKGEAALYLVERLHEKYLPICVGDDTTDETLFNVFSGSGITIRVGFSKRTAAKYYLKRQSEVPLLLQYINNMLHIQDPLR
jgi:trehalose-phosphatase